MVNLMENAAHYGGGVTEIAVAPGRAEQVEVTVDDAGPGIDPLERLKIFERFYRGSASGRRGTGTGTGLGLALVAEHMRVMQGDVRVDSSPAGRCALRPHTARARRGRPERRVRRRARRRDGRPIRRTPTAEASREASAARRRTSDAGRRGRWVRHPDARARPARSRTPRCRSTSWTRTRPRRRRPSPIPRPTCRSRCTSSTRAINSCPRSGWYRRRHRSSRSSEHSWAA